MQRVCVFSGSNFGSRVAYTDAAKAFGIALAIRGIGLVYGGSRVGLMGLLADAALEQGGEVIGVLPKPLLPWGVAHLSLTQLHVVDSLHERKALMAGLSDAFLALPGGLGTLEEFCEILTWAQLGLHSKPCCLLNIDGFFDPLLAMLDHCVAECFLKPEHRALVLVARSAEGVFEQFAQYRPSTVHKWMDLDQP